MLGDIDCGSHCWQDNVYVVVVFVFVIQKWKELDPTVAQTGDLHATITFLWQQQFLLLENEFPTQVIFMHPGLPGETVAYFLVLLHTFFFFLLLHTFFYCCINLSTVAIYFLLLHAYFFIVGHLLLLLQAKNYCCHRKVIVTCKWPFWATVGSTLIKGSGLHSGISPYYFDQFALLS